MNQIKNEDKGIKFCVNSDCKAELDIEDEVCEHCSKAQTKEDEE